MTRALEAFAKGGQVWALKRDELGREYATASDIGRVPRELYDRVKSVSDHADLDEYLDHD